MVLVDGVGGPPVADEVAGPERPVHATRVLVPRSAPGIEHLKKYANGLYFNLLNFCPVHVYIRN